MSAERFIKLVEENQGFELVLGYRDWEDRYMGGKGDTYWYIVKIDDKVKEYYTATFKDGEWKDYRITGKGKKRKETSVSAGSTIRKIGENAFIGQDEPWMQGKKARLIEDGHPHKHYTNGFGDKAVDVSEAYGVTIAYSDLQNVPAGFHLRDVSVGEQVEPPK